MKIAIVSSTFPASKHGGVPTYVDGRAAYFQKKCNVSTFALGNNEGKSDRISLGKIKKFKFNFFILWARLIYKIFKYKPDYIEIHSIPIGLPLFFLYKVSYFFHGPARLEAKIEGSNFLVCFLIYILEKICLFMSQKVNVVSNHFMELLLKEHKFLQNSNIRIRRRYPKLNPPKKLDDINNAIVNTNQFVCVRRLVNRTGVSLLIDAFIYALDSGLNKDSILYIVGTGPAENEISEKINNSKYANNFKLLGPIPDDKRNKLYLESAYNLVPTIGYEGFGLIVVEAGFLGCPSIVTDVGALSEVIGTLDEIGGIVKPNIESIAKGLLERKTFSTKDRIALSSIARKKYSVAQAK